MQTLVPDHESFDPLDCVKASEVQRSEKRVVSTNTTLFPIVESQVLSRSPRGQNFRGRVLVLFGCGGHARSVADIYLQRFPGSSILFVDKNGTSNEKILGFPVQPFLPEPMDNCFIAIGDNGKRKSVWEALRSSKKLDPIIARTALVSPYAEIGRNVFIGNLAHIGPEAKVGHNTIVNTGSIIEHEVVVGDHCHIGPKAVISGRCKVGNLVFLGVGATVKDSIHIGSNIIIGAGAVVVKDLTEPGIYVGCPAKLLGILTSRAPRNMEK